MENLWIQEGQWARGENNRVKFGDLVKPFGRKYKGGWRIFGISKNGEIMLVSDECIGEISLWGFAGYRTGIDQLERLCIDTVKSSKVASVRSINGFDFTKLDKERNEILKKTLFDVDYWLATEYVYSATLYHEMGLEAVLGGIRINMPLEKFDGSCWNYNITLGVRAIVTLRKNVEFTKTTDGNWKI